MSNAPSLELEVLAAELSIHRLPADSNLIEVLSALPKQPESSALFATLHSDEELSIVCDARLSVTAPDTSGPWRALRVTGELDFSLTGILSGLTAPLAAAGISIFAISSYNTDYLLVRAATLAAAIQQLRAAGFSVNEQPAVTDH